ncbi:6-phosphofructokinase, alpha subunit, partial [Gonapodya sp. JEL0774]
ATVQSHAAVDAVVAGISAGAERASTMIGISHNEITRVALQEAVEVTKAGSDALKKGDFRRAMELRDPDFNEMWRCWVDTALKENNSGWSSKGRRKQESKMSRATKPLRFALLHSGAPSPGMNQTTRTLVRCLLNRGHTPLAVHDGFPGLVEGKMRELTWGEVHDWATLGGSKLGTRRDHPVVGRTRAGRGGASPVRGKAMDPQMVKEAIWRNEIDGLVVVGGFEGFAGCVALKSVNVGVPLVVIPATISNNVPGTEFSIGSDTALNAIIEATDRLLQSADSNRRRVFVVEVMGGQSGYLATMAGLASGAMTAITPEHEPSLKSIQNDLSHLTS